MWAHPVAKDEFLAGSKIAAKVLLDAIAEKQDVASTKTFKALAQSKISRDDVAEASAEQAACEMLAGSLIVLSHKIIDLYGVQQEKGEGALHFENEINRIVSENPGSRIKNNFEMPFKFCLGRDVGDLPLGIIVYGARNQYCHFGEERRLNPINELVFNHLQQLYDDAGWLNFDAKDGGRILSSTATAALHWTAGGADGSTGFERFCEDMADVTGQPY